jgi:undecaprenyl-diphosphatase
VNLLLLDQKLFLFLNSFHAEFLNSTMLVLSGQLLWIPFVVWFVFLSRKFEERRESAFFILFLVMLLVCSDVTSSYLFKNIFTRMRPCRVEELKPLIYNFGQKCGGKFGFISSHASNSFGLVTFSVLSLRRFMKLPWIYFSLPILVSLSRVYLGVHYPGDVVVGALNGVMYAYIFAYLFKQTQGARRESSQV